MSSTPARRTVLALSLLLASACTRALPRYPAGFEAVAVGVARADMRRMETQKLILYYPRGLKLEALRVAARLEYCRREMEKLTRIHDFPASEKAVFILPDVPLNNAFVTAPIGGLEMIGVVPLTNTANYFVQMGMLADPASIGCHEMSHYVLNQQQDGLFALIWRVFGRGSLNATTLGIDAWFHEGLAVYNETRLLGRGRLWMRYFDGLFEAGMQKELRRKRFQGGLLSALHRRPVGGGQYLIGSRFIDYLARRYGEERIWKVAYLQGDSLLPVLNVSGRFQKVYGASLSHLLDDFAADFRSQHAPRSRPAEQRTLALLGREAQIARSRSGRIVAVRQDLDQPIQISVYDRDGSEILSRRLTDLFLGRRLVSPSVSLTSGLSMTADGNHAYFVMGDQGPVMMEMRLMHLDVVHDRLEVVAEDVGGAGGSVRADGRYYYLTRPDHDRVALYEYDLYTHEVRELARPAARHFLDMPFVSPDGTRLVVTEGSDAGIRQALYDARSGARLGEVAAPAGPVFQANWMDDGHVVYAADDGQRLQGFVTDLSTGTYRQITDAPYLAGLPFSDGEHAIFMNRDGWHWTLDVAPHLAAPATAEPAAAKVEGPPAPGARVPEPDSRSAGKRQRQARARAWPRGVGPAGARFMRRRFGARCAPAETRGPARYRALADEPASEVDGVPGEAPPVLEVAEEADPHGKHPYAYRHHRLPDDQPVQVISDHAYSLLDGLFIPQAWGPWVAVRPESQVAVGAFLTAGDRLGLQRYALAAGYDQKAKQPGASLSYNNIMLAPFMLQLDAQYIGRLEKKTSGFGPALDEPLLIKEVVASALFSRSWYQSHFAGLGANVLTARYELEGSGALLREQRFIGPSLFLGHQSAEHTPYAGTRLGLALIGSATYYPERLAEAPFETFDVRGELALTTPLPLSRRHTLTLGGRARGLLGTPAREGLLQVGGGADVVPIAGDDVEAPTGEHLGGLLPAALRFVESLRGFEDRALYGREALLGDATYTYPIIIDWGTASTIKVLPAFFVRQIDLQLFGAAAWMMERGREVAAAAGGSLILKMALWLIPLAPELQVAKRLTYDENWTFFFRMGATI